MKRLAFFFAVCFFACFVVLSTGCGFYNSARKAVQESAEDLKGIDKKLNELYERFKVVKKEYEDAVASGDKDKIKAASELMLKIAAEVSAQRELYEQGKVALENAVRRAEEAKGTDEYIGNIFGTILGALGSIFGVGAAGFAASKTREIGTMRSAIKKTAANVDTHISADEWDKFVKSMRDSLSVAEQDALNKATGKDALLS